MSETKWAKGDKAMVFRIDEAVGNPGFLGVECVVVELGAPEWGECSEGIDDQGKLMLEHPSGMRDDFWPDDVARPGPLAPAVQRVDKIDAISDACFFRYALETRMASVARWQASAFGETSPLCARATKLVAESLEVLGAVNDYVSPHHEDQRAAVLGELADVIFLVTDLARGLDISIRQLSDAVADKLAVNRLRTWVQDPETGEYSGSKL